MFEELERRIFLRGLRVHIFMKEHGRRLDHFQPGALVAFEPNTDSARAGDSLSASCASASRFKDR